MQHLLCHATTIQRGNNWRVIWKKHSVLQWTLVMIKSEATTGNSFEIMRLCSNLSKIAKKVKKFKFPQYFFVSKIKFECDFYSDFDVWNLFSFHILVFGYSDFQSWIVSDGPPYTFSEVLSLHLEICSQLLIKWK